MFMLKIKGELGGPGSEAKTRKVLMVVVVPSI